MLNLLVLVILICPFTAFSKEEPEIIPVAKKEEQKDIFNLTSYNPVYLLYHPHKTKIQASFKYKLHRKYNLYAGYSHLIMWDFNETSKPFLDVNYNPEIFYRWNLKNHMIFESIDFIPYGHNSNGKDNQDSRSLDYAGTQFNFKYNVKQNVIFRSSLRLRYFANIEETNRNYRRYTGPAELKMSLTGFTRGLFDKGELTARLYSGGDFGQNFTRGGQEIGFAFRILGVDITPSFYLQYFHGYNESLRYYNEKEHIVRFGILL